MPANRPFYRSLHFQVLAGIILGIALGAFAPATAVKMKPLGDGFIRLIRMIIAPIVYVKEPRGLAPFGVSRWFNRAAVRAPAGGRRARFRASAATARVPRR